MCVCACVLQRVCAYNRAIWPFHPKGILDFWLVDVAAGVTQEEGHTGFFTRLPSASLCLDFSREEDSAVPFRRP